MLTCKKCGAQMSGIDLVCKECGTPWGKTGKSKAPLFFSLILVCLFSFCLYLHFIRVKVVNISNHLL